MAKRDALKEVVKKDRNEGDGSTSIPVDETPPEKDRSEYEGYEPTVIPPRDEYKGFKVPYGMSLPQRRAWKKAIDDESEAMQTRADVRTRHNLRDTAKGMGETAYGFVEPYEKARQWIGRAVKDPEVALEAGEFIRGVSSGDRESRKKLAEGASMGMVEPAATLGDIGMTKYAAEEGKYGEAALYGASVLLPFVSAGWLKTALKAGEVPPEAAKKIAELEKRYDAGDVTDDMQIRRELAAIEDAHKAEYMQSKPLGGGSVEPSALLTYVQPGWLKNALETGRVPAEAAEKIADLERQADFMPNMQIRRELAAIENAHRADFMQSTPPSGGIAGGGKITPETPEQKAARLNEPYDYGLGFGPEPKRTDLSNIQIDYHPDGPDLRPEERVRLNKEIEAIQELMVDPADPYSFGMVDPKWRERLSPDIAQRYDALKELQKADSLAMKGDREALRPFMKSDVAPSGGKPPGGGGMGEFEAKPGTAPSTWKKSGGYDPKADLAGDLSGFIDPVIRHNTSPPGSMSALGAKVDSRYGEKIDPMFQGPQDPLDFFDELDDATLDSMSKNVARRDEQAAYFDFAKAYKAKHGVYPYKDTEYSMARRMFDEAYDGDATPMLSPPRPQDYGLPADYENIMGFDPAQYPRQRGGGGGTPGGGRTAENKMLSEISTREAFGRTSGGRLFKIEDDYIEAADLDDAVRLATDADGFAHYTDPVLRGPLGNVDMRSVIKEASPEESAKYFELKRQNPQGLGGGRSIDDIEGPSEAEIQQMIEQGRFGDPEQLEILKEDMRRMAELEQQGQLERGRVRSTRTPGAPGASGKIPEGTSRAERKGGKRERPKPKTKKDE